MLQESWFGLDIPTVGGQDVGRYVFGRGVVFICSN